MLTVKKFCKYCHPLTKTVNRPTWCKWLLLTNNFCHTWTSLFTLQLHVMIKAALFKEQPVTVWFEGIFCTQLFRTRSLHASYQLKQTKNSKSTKTVSNLFRPLNFSDHKNTAGYKILFLPSQYHANLSNSNSEDQVMIITNLSLSSEEKWHIVVSIKVIKKVS